MSDVTDALDELVAGERELTDVAEEFRTRAWPQQTRQQIEDASGAYLLDRQDPVPDPSGSFAEVAAYYAMHRIDADQYAELATAAAEAMAAAPAPGTPAGTVNEGIPS